MGALSRDTPLLSRQYCAQCVRRAHAICDIRADRGRQQLQDDFRLQLRL